MIHRRKYFSFQRDGFFVRRFQCKKNTYVSIRCMNAMVMAVMLLSIVMNDPHAVHFIGSSRIIDENSDFSCVYVCVWV